MTNFHDNPFEVDGSMHNVRVMRNMMINSASHAFCNQPAIGGPVYWIRNIAYHMPGGSTRLTGGSAGVIFYNNTMLSETQAQGASNVHWAQQSVSRRELGAGDFQRSTRTPTTPRRITTASGRIPARRIRSPGTRRRGRRLPTTVHCCADAAPVPRRASSLETRQYDTLEEYSRATHQDQHSVLVDYDVFVNVPQARRAGRRDGPESLQGGIVRLQAEAGSTAVDRGKALPNVTDGFAGAAPDLGAIELGQTAPHYGPRD